MNTVKTRDLVKKHHIITLKGDKSAASLNKDAVDQLLVNLGNKGRAIPYVAIFPAGQPNKPILLDGIITQGMVSDAIAKAAARATKTAPAAKTGDSPVATN